MFPAKRESLKKLNALYRIILEEHTKVLWAVTSEEGIEGRDLMFNPATFKFCLLLLTYTVIFSQIVSNVDKIKRFKKS